MLLFTLAIWEECNIIQSLILSDEFSSIQINALKKLLAETFVSNNKTIALQ